MTSTKFFTWLAYLFLVVVVFFIALNLIFRPSHDRVWEIGHEQLPAISVTNDLVTIENYRYFKWTGPFEATPNYETRQFLLSDITGVSVLISHFSEQEGLAHIFLSFELATGTPIAISLETRREVGEKFSPLLGILRQFEIIYVVGDERDLIGVRTNHRDERVYLYPTHATAAQAQQLFQELTEAITAVYTTPQMYNTLTRNCTNEITRRVEKMSTLNFPFTWKTVLPGYFDEVLYEMGIIATETSFTETKAAHLIKNTAANPSSSTYSQDIRASLPSLK